MSRQTPEPAPTSDANDAPVYCICRRSDDDENMILCEKCGTWFHLDCIGLTLPQAMLMKLYHCADCQQKHGLVSEWELKCRLEDCFTKVEGDAKYCCPEHAVAFFSEKLSQVVGMKPSDAANIVKVSGSIDTFKGLGNGSSAVPNADKLLVTPETVPAARPPLSAEQAAATQKEISEIAICRAYLGKAVLNQRNIGDGSICGMDSHLLDPGYMAEHYNDVAADEAAICMQQDCEKHFNWPQRFTERFNVLSQRAARRI